MTLAGFWIGRYGETTARDRFHAPFTSVAVVTVLYAFGALALRFVLGGFGAGRDRRLRAAGDGAAQPAADSCRSTRSSAGCCPRASWQTACTRSGSLASRRPSVPRGFLPSDPRVEEPYLLTPQLALRVAILGFLALAVFAILFLRLWALQVLSGDKYLAQASDNRVRTLRIDAPRGSILDRNGRMLVRNVLGTSLEVWPADLPKNRAARELELRRLATVVGIPVKQLEARLREHADDPLTPVVIRRGIHDDQIYYVNEHQIQFPGVQLADSYLRKYPHRSLGAHFLGHVGEISAAELKAMKRDGYSSGDWIGQAGVEATYDTYLRGRDGSTELTVDSRGRPTSVAQTKVTPAARQHAAAHDRHQPPAGGRAGAARTGSRSRNDQRRAGRRTEGRSSRSTRATARCSRSPRTRRTSRRST